MNKASLFTSLSCEWNTPSLLYDELLSEFNFDDDPARVGQIDALFRKWGKRVYVNPPYGPEIKFWLNKALGQIESKETELCISVAC